MFTEEEYAEAINAINNINQEIFENNQNNKLVEEYNSLLYLETDGYCCHISFFDIVLWDSEEDSDRLIEETDNYIPIEQYVRRKLKTTIDNINKIVLY